MLLPRSETGKTATRMIAVWALVLLAVVTAQGKERAWETGKLLDSDHASTYVGSIGTAMVGGPILAVPINRVYQTYIVDLGEYVYVAREQLRGKAKPVQITVNAPVKVAIEKDKLYLISDDGKERKAEIVKRILKPTETEQAKQ